MLCFDKHHSGGTPRHRLHRYIYDIRIIYVNISIFIYMIFYDGSEIVHMPTKETSDHGAG